MATAIWCAFELQTKYAHLENVQQTQLLAISSAEIAAAVLPAYLHMKIKNKICVQPEIANKLQRKQFAFGQNILTTINCLRIN